VRRVRERARDVGAHTYEELVPLAATLDSSGARYPTFVVRLRVDTYVYIERLE
jgi:hypothetical protein